MASCVSLQSISCLCDLWVLLCVKTYHVFHFLVNNQIQQIKSCLFLQEQNKIHVATLWGLKWCEREIYIQVSIIQKLQRGKQNLFNFVLITLHVGNVVVNFLQYTKMQLEIYYILFSIFRGNRQTIPLIRVCPTEMHLTVARSARNLPNNSLSSTVLHDVPEHPFRPSFAPFSIRPSPTPRIPFSPNFLSQSGTFRYRARENLI